MNHPTISWTILIIAMAGYCRISMADDADLLDVADLRIRDPFVVTGHAA